MISGTLRHEGARRSALKGAARRPRLTCTSFRDAATAGRAPVGRFEVDVTSVSQKTLVSG